MKKGEGEPVEHSHDDLPIVPVIPTEERINADGTVDTVFVTHPDYDEDIKKIAHHLEEVGSPNAILDMDGTPIAKSGKSTDQNPNRSRSTYSMSGSWGGSKWQPLSPLERRIQANAPKDPRLN